jgi:hypothetical protein
MGKTIISFSSIFVAARPLPGHVKKKLVKNLGEHQPYLLVNVSLKQERKNRDNGKCKYLGLL